MPVLLIAEADLPEEAYADIAGKMTPLIREPKGLIFHAGRPDPAGGCWPGVLLGRGARRELLKRGLALKTRAGPAVHPHPGPLTWFQCVDDIEGTRARHAREDSWAREWGDDRMRAERLGYLAMVELQAGQWDLAEQHAGRSCETLEQGDVSGRSAYAFAWRSLIDAYRGRVDRARTTLQPLVAEAARTEKAWWGAILLSVVGFVEFSTYLVENYHPGLGAEELRRIVSRVRDAVAQMTRDGKAIRYLRSAIVPADESFFCVIEAASEELAREAYARAGIPFERISPALLEEG